MVDTMSDARIAELPLNSQINLRGRPGDPAFQARIKALLGEPLPDQCGQLRRYMIDPAGQRLALKALWLAPDEWLVVADFDSRADLLQAFELALEGCHHAVTDLSANRKIIALEGALALDLLAQGCALDLDVAVFPSATAIQTRMARIQVIIERVNNMPLFHLYVRNSFAEYLLKWLAAAAPSRLATVQPDSRF